MLSRIQYVCSLALAVACGSCGASRSEVGGIADAAPDGEAASAADVGADAHVDAGTARDAGAIVDAPPDTDSPLDSGIADGETPDGATVDACSTVALPSLDGGSCDAGNDVPMDPVAATSLAAFAAAYAKASAAGTLRCSMQAPPAAPIPDLPYTVTVGPVDCARYSFSILFSYNGSDSRVPQGDSMIVTYWPGNGLVASTSGTSQSFVYQFNGFITNELDLVATRAGCSVQVQATFQNLSNGNVAEVIECDPLTIP
jgi:hypothetical protein